MHPVKEVNLIIANFNCDSGLLFNKWTCLFKLLLSCSASDDLKELIRELGKYEGDSFRTEFEMVINLKMSARDFVDAIRDFDEPDGPDKIAKILSELTNQLEELRQIVRNEKIRKFISDILSLNARVESKLATGDADIYYLDNFVDRVKAILGDVMEYAKSQVEN